MNSPHSSATAVKNQSKKYVDLLYITVVLLICCKIYDTLFLIVEILFIVTESDYSITILLRCRSTQNGEPNQTQF